jgi:orotate phosphoribosyltransferase
MTTSLALVDDLLAAVSATRGHFRYESGHHGDLWIDLDGMFVDARRMRGWATALAAQAAEHRPDIACGPLTGGAFVAQMMAAELGAEFVFAERHASASAVDYRVPSALRARLDGRRVIIVDDAVNAGSALLGTLADVRACGGAPIAFASLLALGDAERQISMRHGIPFITLASLHREM